MQINGTVIATPHFSYSSTQKRWVRIYHRRRNVKRWHTSNSEQKKNRTFSTHTTAFYICHKFLSKDKFLTSSWNYATLPGPLKKGLFSHFQFARALIRAVSSHLSRSNFLPVSKPYEGPERGRPFSFTRFNPEERGRTFLRNIGTRL
jgi:hypothetical protein